MSEINQKELQALEERIASLNIRLEKAKLAVKEWTESKSQLALNAAEARAKTQGMGRGLGGLILGSKFRASQRSQASRINASISKQVAEKRAKLADGKRQAQELVRSLS